jgi:hypothetical protein
MKVGKTESLIEVQFKKYIEQQGGRAYKFISPGHRGVPDRLCIFPHSISFFVELKAEGGKPSELQKKEFDFLTSSGQLVFLIFGSEGLENWKKWFEAQVKPQLERAKSKIVLPGEQKFEETRNRIITK